MLGPIIGVIGGSVADPPILEMARAVGRGIGKRGGILVTGGLGGVMEAASRGAKEEGGLVLGILPGSQARQANPWVDIPIVTGLSDARNTIIARTAAVLIAIDGSYGTLSEIAFALKFDKPVISLQSWQIDPRIIEQTNAEEAVELAFQLAKAK
ncbi:MAG: TIGR00725 family protein [Calditrichaeota bacterium]|nr:MAG: TIGR00725 family protein [Calditrichota bacterium]